MPIKLRIEACLEMGGNPIDDENCEITKDFIRNLATKITLDGYGKAYLGGLYDLPPNAGEDAFITQGKYIALNCSTETQEEKEAWYILSALEKDKPLPVYRPNEDVLTEIELDHLATDITNKTERSERTEDGKIPLKVFEHYAQMHGLSLDKVLVSQDWVDDILTEEVIEAKKKAKKRVKILWE